MCTCYVCDNHNLKTMDSGLEEIFWNIVLNELDLFTTAIEMVAKVTW